MSDPTHNRGPTLDLFYTLSLNIDSIYSDDDDSDYFLIWTHNFAFD